MISICDKEEIMQIIENKDEFRESLLSWYQTRKKGFALAKDVQSILYMGFRSDVATNKSRYSNTLL